jgi:hypothetical protein
VSVSLTVRHRLADDLSGESGWMDNAAIDWISVDVVGASSFEAAVAVGSNPADGVAECAADVDMDMGVSDYQACIVAAPRSYELGDRRRRGGCAGEKRERPSEYRGSRHSLR